MAASTPYRRTGCKEISAARSGWRIASRMLPSPRSARYSGSARPAWRMNHTGTRSCTSPRHAARNGGAAAMACKVVVGCQAPAMRRSIDDHPFSEADVPPSEDDLQRLSWAVAISDDYEDTEPRVVLTVEEVVRAGAGLVLPLSPPLARRLRVALRDALREIG